MSNWFWKKASYILGLFTVGVLFGLTVFAANIEIKDLDLWLHLKTGEVIVQNHDIPTKDILSCSIKGKPWTNHEWLFQSVLYLVHRHWGPDGVIFMQVLIVTFTLLVLLLLGYSKERQLGTLSVLLLVMLVYQFRFTMRPDILSLLFFALYIYILALHIDSKWSIVALFAVQVLWSNVHGFFFFGPLLVLLGISAEFIKRHVKLPWQWNEAGRLTDVEYARLKKILGVVIVASLVNRQGIIGAWYPIGVLFQLSGESRIFFEHIQELQRPLHWNTLLSTSSYIYYKLLILISFFSFVFNRKKIDIGDFFVWILFLAFSLVAARNIVFFAFAAYLVCMTNFINISLKDIVPLRFTTKKFQYITTCVFKIFIIAWMLQYGSSISLRGYFDFDKYERKSEFGGIAQRSYPNQAADFLIEHEIKGNFFNDFNSGAYLIGRCYPNIRLYIDGRTEVYGPDFFKRYLGILTERDTESFEEDVKKYNLTGVFLNSVHSTIPEELLSYIYENEDWVLIYLDYDAVIFLKDITENKEWIDELRLDLSAWSVEEMDLKRLGSMRAPPYRYINRAYTLETLAFDEAALEELDYAQKISPGHIEIYKLRGKIYGKREDYTRAFENFRIAASMSPGDLKIRLNLGFSYERLDDFENAIKQYNRLITKRPKDPKGYFMLARVLAKSEQYEDAVNYLRTALPLTENGIGDFIEIADIIFESGDFTSAQKIYEMSLAKKEDAGVLNKIGLCYQAMGLKSKAGESFDRGLVIDPENEEIKKNLKKLKRKK